MSDYGFLIAAAIAAAIAGFFLWQSNQHERSKRRLLSVETSTTAEVRELAKAAADAAGPGAFAQPVELAGVATAGPHGLLTSPLSETACLWHQHQVVRRYRHVTHDSEGRRQTSTREETMTNASSQDPFTLRDAGGEMLVTPSHGVQGGRRVVSRFEEDDDVDRTVLKVGSFSLDLPGGRRDDTLGYEYKEWVLLPDTRVFVQGEATDVGGVLEVRDPQGGERIVVSTRSEADMITSADKGKRTSRLLAALAAAVAVVLLVIGIVRAVV